MRKDDRYEAQNSLADSGGLPAGSADRPDRLFPQKSCPQKEFQILSAAEYLGDALVAEGLVKGTTGDYGLYIDTVDNETADKSKEEWWCITKGGQAVMTGISTTPFADGDTFELTLTVGY